MNKLDNLLADLKATDAKIDGLLSHDEMTAEQLAEHDQLVADRGKLVAAIGRERARLDRDAERARLEADATASQERATELANRQVNPGDNRITQAAAAAAPITTPPAKLTIPAHVKRFGRLANFKGEVGGLSADERAYRFGMFCLAKLALDMPHRYNPRYNSRFGEAIKFYEQNWGQEIQAAAHQSNDGLGTQYLIPTEFGTDLIDLREQYGVVRQLFRRVPMTSDTRTDPRRTGGLTAYFPGEGNAGTESNKGWDNVSLTARKLMVLSRWTNEVNADAVINFGDDLAGEITYAYTNKEDDCGFNGTGTSTYGGIVGVRSKLGSAGIQTQGTSNTWAAIVLADFHGVMGKLPQYAYAAGPEWVCHNAFFHTVMAKLILASGGTTTTELINGIRTQMFLGYPVRVSQVLPSETATATVSALFGAFRLGAAFGDRQQDEISFSEHATIGGESLWERGQIGIRGTERFDINVHDAGSSSVAGPIVGLKTGN